MNKPTILFACLAILCLAAKPKTHKRSQPPVKWENTALLIFESDAYSLLPGRRPDDLSSKEHNSVALKHSTEEQQEEFDRGRIMKVLRTAEKALEEGLNNPKALAADATELISSATLVELMGRRLFTSDPDYGGDDAYLKQAEEMVNGARLLKVHAAKGDYEGIRTALSGVKSSCVKCHARFR